MEQAVDLTTPAEESGEAVESVELEAIDEVEEPVDWQSVEVADETDDESAKCRPGD